MDRYLPSWTRAGLRIMVLACLLLSILLLLGQDLYHHRRETRGIEDGSALYMPPLEQPRVAANVSLQQYDAATLEERLALLADLGVDTIRQRFPWSEIEPQPGEYAWATWDRLVAKSAEHGLRIIAVLDTSPQWARSDWESDNPWAPPQQMDNYARFASALAQRYRGRVYAYQIWDQPNIVPHWGKGEVSPAGYVEMLQVSSPAIRAADPQALIVAGGLAPTTATQGPNLNDVSYLREIYRRDAGDYFDVLGVKAYGFWSGPNDRRVAPDVLNLSRAILLREEMRRRGEQNKPVWALEGGWCALEEDWQGEPSPQGSDAAAVQQVRFMRAMTRIRQEWPWMTLVCTYHLQPSASEQDPRWGYALLDPKDEPTGWLEEMRDQAGITHVLYPGVTLGLPTQSSPAQSGDWQEFIFWGRRLALDLEEGTMGELAIRLDYHDQATIEVDSGERGQSRIVVAESRDTALHQIAISDEEGLLSAVSALAVGQKTVLENLWKKLLVSAAAVSLLVITIWRNAQRIPWRRGWQLVKETWCRVPRRLRILATPSAFLLLCIVPHSLLRVPLLAIYATLALMQPTGALWIALASIPFAPLHVGIGPGSFSVSEIAAMVATMARIWDELLAGRQDRLSIRERMGSIAPLDILVAIFALLGIISCLYAEYRHVALRELRTQVIEPVLLYFLLRTCARPNRAFALRLIDLTVLTGSAVALYALVRYPSPSGVILADGVRRARGFYGSPNNLALYLERILPLGIAMALWGRTLWRRRLYALASLILALALALTFSRGAWVVGVPAALLVLLCLEGLPGSRRLAYAALVILALLALCQAPRIISLLDLSSSTAGLRLDLWRASWDMIEDHPWLGVGLDNFLYYYGDYIRPGAEVDRWLSHPHNCLFDFWLRLGIAGALLAVALLIAFVRSTKTTLATLPEGDLRASTVGLAAAMAACIAHGSVDSSYFVAELAYWFMLALAWIELAKRLNVPVDEF